MPLLEWAIYAAELPALLAERTLAGAEAAAIPWLRPSDRRRALAHLRGRAGLEPEPSTTGGVDGVALRYVTATDVRTVNRGRAVHAR